MELKILLGIDGNLKALNIVGHFLSWYEILTLGGIVFAISEFMERNKFRTFVFKMSNLSRNVFELIILSMTCVIFANLLPLLNREPKPVPLLHYPAFWELTGLILFSIALILIIVSSLFPYSFIPRITKRNCNWFFWNIRNRILNEHSNESLEAISTIIMVGKNWTTFRQVLR